MLKTIMELKHSRGQQLEASSIVQACIAAWWLGGAGCATVPCSRAVACGLCYLDLQMGIVGLPNVGKSTLFNVLTKLSIPAENFPFCTIEPNQVCVGAGQVLACAKGTIFPAALGRGD